ncbi:MAG: hypothetical protein RLZZ336_1660 [Cyanobacteriota bacterium]|jgi:uncharacterized protein (DUF39 family)
MAPRRRDAAALAPRSLAALQQRQAGGDLRVLSAADFRTLVRDVGLHQAYDQTDVVVAADAAWTDQGVLLLSLGPSDPPIRLREVQLGGVNALVGGGSGDVVLSLGGGLTDPARRSGAQVLTDLLAGRPIALSALGEPTALQPRLELSGSLGLGQVAAGRLLLQRAVVENGIVAVSSAEGLLRTPHGPLLGPLVSGLITGGGAGSIGLTMPGLALLGPGSPLLVGGGLGWVVGAGSGHNPSPQRQPLGHACGPGAAVAVTVDLDQLDPAAVHSCFLEGHGAALLVPVAAPVPLLNGTIAQQAAAGPEALQVPVLDLGIPRRVKPRLADVSYAALASGALTLGGATLRCAPAHSPRLAAAAGARLAALLREGTFPLQAPLRPLSNRSALLPLDL